MGGKRFPNDHLLVGTEWLADHLGSAELCIVEVTPPGTGYAFGHIPRAVYLNLDDVLTGRVGIGPRTIRPVVEVRAVLNRLGLAPDRTIVVYDEIGGPNAAQAFWLLEYLGFPSLRVLEGGIERWMAEGRPVSCEEPRVEPIAFVPALREERLATVDWLALRLGTNELCLIDCRTPQEYEEGHIPGACNRDWERSLELGAYHAFRAPEELRAELAQLGATDGKEIVTYCNTGNRSAHTFLTLRLLGYPQVRNYSGSWMEWERRPDLPKARGGEPQDRF